MADTTEQDAGAGASRDETNSKVGRLIQEYGLDGLDQELADRWTAIGDDRRSLRDLATMFNERLLGAKLQEQGVETLAGEVENTYRLLTDGEVTTGVRTETRNSLARKGIDVEALEEDFVSHQAVHTYLTEYRGVSREADTLDPEERLQRELETLQRLQNRTVAVTENALERLDETGQLTIGTADVFVDVRIFCPDCGADFSVDELFERGGCRCSGPSTGEYE